MILFAAIILAIGGQMNNERTLFNFSDNKSSTSWVSIDDVVMGGVSNSSFIIKDGFGIFSGSLSLENNGGFASVRAISINNDLNGYEGLKIRVLGDGNTYKIRLRTDDNFDGVAYQINFETEKNEWIELSFPFEEFVPVFRGRKVNNADSLNPENIKQLGFLISDKQEGDFELKIDWIKAY